MNSMPTIKVLGITFQHNMDWQTHIVSLESRLRPKISLLRKISNKLSMEQFLRVAIAQIYSIMYYAAPVWLNVTLKSAYWLRLRTLHYRVLRAAVKDFKRRRPNRELDKVCQRATPRMWSHYATSSLVIKTLRDRSPQFLTEEIMTNLYTIRRRPNSARFFDNSRGKIGRSRFCNRLNVMNGLTDWYGLDLGNDAIRIQLKKDLNFDFIFD